MVLGLVLAVAAGLSVVSCGRESRESSTTALFESMRMPPDVTVKEYPQDQNGKRWELTRSTRRINRSHLTVPGECRERPTMFDSALYVSYNCPDPIVAGSSCLVDLSPTRGSQGSETTGVDLVIKCGFPPATTVVPRTTSR